jgi:hypothetical protein
MAPKLTQRKEVPRTDLDSLPEFMLRHWQVTLWATQAMDCLLEHILIFYLGFKHKPEI